MIKAIIFDCFGVLVEASLEPFIKKHLSSNPDKIRIAHQIDKKASQGTLSYEQLLENFSELTGLPLAQVRKELDNNPSNDKLLSYINEELKQKYKIGFLSNASENWLSELFTPEQINIFDDIILSFEMGVAKPDEKIFKITAERLGVEPYECVFIDDVDEYCTGARDVGFHAIKYNTYEQMISELEELLK